MNKTLLVGAVTIFGFIALTAFGGKTLAEQKAEIASAITAKLEGYRTELQTACDERVASAAQTKADEMIAAKAAEAPTTKGMVAAPKKKAPTKGGASGPKVDPLPQPTKPAPTDPKRDKTAGNAPAPNTEAKQSKTAGEAPAPNTNAKRSKTAGGGGN